MSPVPSIFILDDAPDNIELLSKSLAGEGNIRFALSGPRGLEKIRQHQPDLILLDVMMPDMDGYAVFAELKKHPQTAAIPVIFVTAKNDPLSETLAIQAGAVDFIHKPINPTVVRARVRMHLAHQAREREVRQLNAELEQRVQERTRALKDALERAQSAQKIKANLLANMSHEFRTPLNTVLGMSHVVSKQVGDAQIAEKLAKITVSGKNLLALLNDILDMARLEANKLQIETMDFHLQKVLDASLGLQVSRAQAKGLALVQEIDPQVPLDLHGDPVRLGQILGNLVSNAIKFSNRGQITLRVTVAETRNNQIYLRIEVQDQGVGIGLADQARIFESFEQADGSSTREHGGVGIGLTLCKFLCQLMGGTIGVESTPGVGSTFWVLMPFTRGAPSAGPGTAESASTRQVALHLMALLAEDGMAAQSVWQTSRAPVEHLLGSQAPAFASAIESFDFPAALHLLQQALKG